MTTKDFRKGHGELAALTLAHAQFEALFVAPTDVGAERPGCISTKDSPTNR